MPQTPKRVIVVPPGGTATTFVEADLPSGLAFRPDGTLLVAETGGGRIIEVSPDGSVRVLVDGLCYPQALAVDGRSNVYAITGPAAFSPPNDVNPVPIKGDTLVKISADGRTTIMAVIPGMAGVAIDVADNVFVTANDTVFEIYADGSHAALATGFVNAIGLTFDLAGSLYVSDAYMNAIARIGGFEHGSLEGIVTDSSGRPIEGARIQIHRVSPTVTGLVVTTDEHGQFHLPAAPATYTITVTAQDFKTATLTGITVTGSSVIPLSVALEK